MFSTISEYDDWNKVNLCGCCSKYLKMYPGQISEYFILAPIRKIELVDLVWLMIYYKYKNGIQSNEFILNLFNIRDDIGAYTNISQSYEYH